MLLILIVLALWITVQCSRSSGATAADDFSGRGPSLSAGLSHGRDLARELYYEMTDVFRQLVGFNNMRSRRNWSFAGVAYHPAAVDDESGTNPAVEMISTDKNRFPASSPWSSVVDGDDEDSGDEGPFLSDDLEMQRLTAGEKMRRAGDIGDGTKPEVGVAGVSDTTAEGEKAPSIVVIGNADKTDSDYQVVDSSVRNAIQPGIDEDDGLREESFTV